MKRSRKPVQMMILLGVLLIGGYAISTTLFASDGNSIPKVGDKPNDFKLVDLEGNVHELSDYKGKPVVINFWGSFCPPCVEEMPEFEQQYQKWKDKGLTILAINLSEDRLSVDNFVRNFNLSYPILRDVNRKTEKSYGLRSYPTTFFVNEDGKIEEIMVGGMTQQDIDERVERLLS